MWSECIPALASLTSIVKREPVWNVLDLQEAAPQDSHKHLRLRAQALWWEDWGGRCATEHGRRPLGRPSLLLQTPLGKHSVPPCTERKRGAASCEDGYSRQKCRGQMWLPVAGPLPGSHLGENTMISLSLLFLRGL